MAFYQTLAVILCLVLAGLAGLHFYWAAGGELGLRAAVPTKRGRPLFVPGPLACAAVGCALAAAGVVSALRGGLLSLGLPGWLAQLGIWTLVLVFGLRALGDFHYVGLFKRVRDTEFARRDSLLYSPLCALIAALAAGLGALAP